LPISANHSIILLILSNLHVGLQLPRVCFNNQFADIGMPILANDLGNLGNVADIGT